MGWVFSSGMMLVLSLAITTGCQSVAGYAPVSPPSKGDAGADATPADTGPPDVAFLDTRSSDTTIDPSDLSGPDGWRDSSVDVPLVTDSSVDVPLVTDSFVDLSSPTDSTLDQASPDLSADGLTPNDASIDEAAPPTVQISEIFPWARAVIDARGEWFELFNSSPDEVSLLNWQIADTRNVHRIIDDVRIAPYGYAVLGVNGKTAQNGGVDVDYEYGTDIRLDNDNPEKITLRRADGSFVDEVNFDVGGWGFIEGQALSYLGGGDKNSSGGWCAEWTQWLGTTGDYGTPGGPRGCGI